tara:strand:- start:119 stop:430 length:312 start_codon:yes stop_codon:yes gene_type:complete
MIKINTIPESERDLIKLVDIDLSSRILDAILNKTNFHHFDNETQDIITLLDLKKFVLKNHTSLMRIPNFGRKSYKEVLSLLEHAYPNVSFNNHLVKHVKYTFR